MTKQENWFEREETPNGAVLFVMVYLFAFGVSTGWMIWGFSDTPEYDQDCLDKLANEICIEHNIFYGYGEDKNINDNFMNCYLTERSLYNHKIKWLEGEKESCIK